MNDWGASIIRDLDTFFFTLSVQEAAVIGSLLVSLMSLCAAFVLFRRQRQGETPPTAVRDVVLPETVTPAVHDVAAAQAELRELVREFSVLAAQVLQTVDRNQMPLRLPQAGGAALQLLDRGLTPAEAARATGMTMGEVALLMNLRKAKASTPHLPVMSSIEPGETPDETIEGCGKSNGRRFEVNGNGRQEG